MPISVRQRGGTHPLNFAGKLARTFVESRLVILIIIGIVLYGAIGLIFTPREENPQIIVPGVEVRVAYPGAQPLEVEHALLRPLETLLGAIDGVKHTYGTALPGMAIVQVEFHVGEHKEHALVRAYDHVLRNRDQLPAEAGEPQVKNIDVDNVPVFTLSLASARYSDFELHRMAERVLERLRNVPGIGVNYIVGGPGIGVNYIVGGRQRELRISVDPERLRAFSIPVQQITAAVQTANQATPLGSQVIAGENRQIRLEGHLQSAADVRELVVGTHESRTVHLRDVAEVIDGPPDERKHYTRFSFGAADLRALATADSEMASVTIAIAKRTGIDAVPFTERLRERLDQVKDSLLPPDVHAIITRDDGQKADHTVNRLVEHIFIAVGSVTIVLFLFLGWRAAIIVLLAVPLVIFVVLGSDLLAGPTLNRISLYALILSLGMLVDDAIVVIENAHRTYKKLPAGADQESKEAAVIHSTNEIGNPTTLATFTVVVVFLSLILVSGMLGQYFRPLTFNLPVAMATSLLLAYTVTPWMIRRWLPPVAMTAMSRPDTTGCNADFKCCLRHSLPVPGYAIASTRSLPCCLHSRCCSQPGSLFDHRGYPVPCPSSVCRWPSCPRPTRTPSWLPCTCRTMHRLRKLIAWCARLRTSWWHTKRCRTSRCTQAFLPWSISTGNCGAVAPGSVPSLPRSG